MGSNILAKVDFTYDQIIERMAILKRFISEVQQVRKHMGLRPWNKISIEISHDDFNVVSDNVDYIKKRLECVVNSKSNILADRIFKPISSDDEAKDSKDTKYDSRSIGYHVLIL